MGIRDRRGNQVNKKRNRGACGNSLSNISSDMTSGNNSHKNLSMK
jgi:hypothetical protein